MGTSRPLILVALLVAAVLVGACGQPPTEDDPEVRARLDELAVAAEDDAGSATTLALAALPAGAEVVATRSYRSCVQGQHNWKRDDPFDLSCHVGHVVVVGVPTAATFEADMATLDRVLLDAGFTDRRSPQDESDGLAHVAAHYFDLFGSARGGTDDGERATYGPQDLPPAHYHATADDRDLTISFTGPDDGFLAVQDFRYEGVDGATMDSEDLQAALAGRAYALRVGVERSETW
jgi:hypothetical protein